MRPFRALALCVVVLLGLAGTAAAATRFAPDRAQEGIRLPNSPEAIFALERARHVSRDDLEPGDLVFFNDAGHMGIYVGDGTFVHAPQTGATVSIAKLAGYYTKAFTGAIRIGPLR
jgi:hypothetical protein